MLRNYTKAILATANQKLNSQVQTQHPQTQQALYGNCYKCQSPVDIPGLEAFKCSGECGWVSRKTSATLLDLVGLGGER